MPQRQTFDISFYCRKSKQNKNGYAPVELSIIINGERTYLTLQRKEKPEEFKAAMSSRKVNAIKSYCENQKKLVDDYVQQMAFAGVELTADNLRECLRRGYVAMRYSLGDMWRDLLDNERAKLNTGDIGEETYKKYILAHKALNEANGFNDTTPAQDVDIQHINKLQSYLREKRISQPTIYNYHARCKAAFTLAFQRGKIRATPYAGFKMDKGEHKPRIFLTEQELKQIAQVNLQGERLQRVRDLFLFQCYSGLSYSDMALLERSDFKENKGTKQIYIEKRRKKTNEPFTSIVLEEGKKILEKYDYKLPLLSNQKYNSYLKEIQDACKLDKELHTHLGRTTYVCYLYNRGTSPDVIAKLVGHSTTKTTLRYYAEMDKTTLFSEVKAAERGKRTISNTAAVATPVPITDAMEVVNAYLNKSVFKENVSTLPKDIVSYEDDILSTLLALKNNKNTIDAYRVVFAKCKSNVYNRVLFFESAITKYTIAGEDEQVKKLNFLQKSARRLLRALRNFDKKLYDATK